MDSKKIAVVVVAAVLVIAIAAAGIVYLGMGKALDETDSTLVSVVIPSGATADSIAQALEDNHVIDKASDFKLWSKVKGYVSIKRGHMHFLRRWILIQSLIFWLEER